MLAVVITSKCRTVKYTVPGEDSQLVRAWRDAGEKGALCVLLWLAVQCDLEN